MTVSMELPLHRSQYRARYHSWSALPLLAGVVWGFSTSVVVAEDAATHNIPATAIAQLAAANTARAELARAEGDWKIEKERLLAMIAATQAEQQALEQDAATMEKARDQALQAIAELGDDKELIATREKLQEMGVRIRNGLATISRTVPPGTIATVADDTAQDELFDAAIRALDASERAAETVSVEVVTGQRDGQTEAVKMLRVAGAGAWWVSLDEKAAGTAQMVDGVLQLRVAKPPDQKAIHIALAQAEGRAPAKVVVVPR